MRLSAASTTLPEAAAAPRGARGIAYAPQEQAVFQDLSVEENLRLAVPDRRISASGLERIAGYFPFIAQRLRRRPARCRAASRRC